VATGDTAFAPFSYVEQGVPKGFLVAYAQELEKALGCSITVKWAPWSDAMSSVVDGHADFLLGISETDDRRHTYDFTERILTLKSQLFTRREDFHITELELLQATTIVGVEQGDIVHETIRARYPTMILKTFPNQGATLEALARGEIDTAAGDYYSGRWHLEQLRLSDRIKVVGHPFLVGAYGIAVRKGNRLLLSELNDAIASLKANGASRRIQDNWFGERYFAGRIPWQKLAVAGATVGGALLALLLWIAALRAAVRRATRGLRESEERFRVLVQNSPDAVVVQVDEKFVFANPAAAKIFGTESAETLLGTNVLERFESSQRETIANAIKNVVEHSTPISSRATKILRFDNQPVTVELSCATIRYEDRKAVLAAIRDVTERSKLEDQLRQAQRMEAVGRLAGGVAHDFNNLLTVILSTCNLLETELDTQQIEDVRTIYATAERAAALTKQLLTFSRRTTLHPRAIDANQIVMETVKMLKRLVGEDVRLVTDLDVQLPQVYTDPDQLAQVIMNLVLNARDAMPDGGQILIGSRTLSFESGGQAYGGTEIARGQYVELMVRDEGTGMEDVTAQRLFEPFFTTKEPGKGTGLGLAVVFGVVGQSGGHIALETSLGKGSTFRVRFPRALTPDVAIPKPSGIRDEPTLPTGSERILVVEDAVEVAALVDRRLSSLGYQVLVAIHSVHAEELFRQHPDISLLLTDVVMPGMSGPELAARLVAIRPELRVLFMSGYDCDLVDVQSELLRKPFDAETLAKAVRRTLDAGPCDHRLPVRATNKPTA
jgi:PAS domain S-box-containing protein